MKYAIGVDIGGTKISLVLGNSKGRILSQRILKTQKGAKTRICLNELSGNLQVLIARSGVKKRDILGIGVGIPGAVDSEKGVVPFSPHLTGWKGVPLKKILKQQLKLPVYMSNDANVAALCEKVFGQGKGLQNFVYMTVSTGIGTGLVVHGKLLEGKAFVAGESGHMVVVADGEPWKRGEKGCLEAYASGTAIAKYATKHIRKYPRSKIRKFAGKEPISAKAVALAARAGDSFAKQIFRRAGNYLGIGIANLLNILNPEKVILGGGVLRSAPSVFLSEMRKSCRKNAWPEAMKSCKIVKSKIKGHVGDLGALALVFDRAK